MSRDAGLGKGSPRLKISKTILRERMMLRLPLGTAPYSVIAPGLPVILQGSSEEVQRTMGWALYTLLDAHEEGCLIVHLCTPGAVDDWVKLQQHIHVAFFPDDWNDLYDNPHEFSRMLNRLEHIQQRPIDLVVVDDLTYCKEACLEGKAMRAVEKLLERAKSRSMMVVAGWVDERMHPTVHSLADVRRLESLPGGLIESTDHSWRRYRHEVPVKR